MFLLVTVAVPLSSDSQALLHGWCSLSTGPDLYTVQWVATLCSCVPVSSAPQQLKTPLPNVVRCRRDCLGQLSPLLL